MAHFIHIPKTGGTLVKYLKNDYPEIDIEVSNAHTMTLARLPYDKKACFVIRDPLDRFCSGYWERATMTLRSDKYQKEMKSTLPDFGYSSYRDIENQFLAKYKSPNDVLTAYRIEGVPKEADNTDTPLFQLLTPATRWLGNLENFKTNEGKIEWVCDLKDLSWLLETRFGMKSYTDSFRRRSRSQFDIPQSYEISLENQKWFRSNYAAEEYKIIEYIETRCYFTKP